VLARNVRKPLSQGPSRMFRRSKQAPAGKAKARQRAQKTRTAAENKNAPRVGPATGSTISPCRAGISASALRGDAQVDPSRTNVWIIEAPAGNEETRVNARVRRPAPNVGGPVPSIRMRKGRFPLTHATQRAWHALVRSACIRRPETCRTHSHSVQAEASASGGATPVT
jgi:hypothetical protein